MDDFVRFPLPQVLRDQASADPHRLVATQAETGRETTAGELWAASLTWAARLRAAGIHPGDHVATIVANTVEAFSLWAGIAMLGAVEIPIGPELRGAALEHVSASSGASLLVVDESGASVYQQYTELFAGITVVMRSSESTQCEPVPASEIVFPAESDVALVLFTSGTTGPAKGVLVCWGQLLSTCQGAYAEGGVPAGGCIYSAFPANHIAARTLPYLAWLHGARAVTRERFSTSAFWADVDRFDCTTTSFAAAMASFLLNAPPSALDRSHPLRHVMIAPLIDNWREFADRFDARVCTLFTMTEIGAPFGSGWSPPELPSVVGYVREGFAGHEVRLVDGDDHDVPLGEPGELAVRTQVPGTLNAGYLNREEETRHAWRNGWFHTGDWFRQDERGRFFFAGRMKDAIRRRGQNVSAYEVEREVDRLPGVRASAAVGVPAPEGEEDIYLYVVPEPGEALDPAAVLEQVRPRLARYMLPGFVEIVGELPLTPSGKVHKARLRATAVNRLETAQRKVG